MLLPLLIETTFEFSGGSSASLAQAISLATGKPAAVVDSGEKRLRAAKFAWEGAPDFANETRQFFGFRPATEEERKDGPLGFGTAWPVSLVSTWRPAPRPYLGDGIGSGPAQEGEPSTMQGGMSTDGETRSTNGAAAVQPAAAFGGESLHWFLRTVPLALYADKASPAEVRAAVLAALGADADGQPRWAEFRLRYVAGLNDVARLAAQMPQNTGLPTVRAAQVKSLAFGALRDADMKKAFASPGVSVEVAGPVGSPVYRAVWGFFSLVPQPTSGRGPGSRRNIPAGALAARFDPRQPVAVRFTSPNVFAVMGVTEQGQTTIPLP